MRLLELAGEACFAVADLIRCAESEEQASVRVEAFLVQRALPDEYTSAIRWMAERAIASSFAGNPQATVGGGTRKADSE